MKDITKKYANDEITVVWKPSSCIHSTLCWKGLIEVFNPRESPWVKLENSNTETIIEQIKKCPSGALSFYFNNEMNSSPSIDAETKIEILQNGPLLVYGNVQIQDSIGNQVKKNKVTAFCRCGKSLNKPFCDGSHISSKFEG